MIALGIDCATKCGWALVGGPPGREELLDHGVIDLSGKKLPSWNPVAALALRCRDPKLPPIDVVAIEMPWLGDNPHTAIRLGRYCGQFEQAFGPLAEVEVIRATEWQSKVLGRLGGKRRETLKPAAVLWARGQFGAKLTEDEADAAGIAVFSLRKRSAAWRALGRRT